MDGDIEIKVEKKAKTEGEKKRRDIERFMAVR